MANPRIPAAQQKRATIDRRTWTLVGLVAGVLVLGLLLVSHRYGYHRDELYFVAAGRRLAWGFVDQPPLTPAIARLVDLLPGDLSPTALRVVPALSAGACVVLTAVLARRFGAGRRAVVVAAVFAAVGGFFVAVGHLLSTTTFDVLIWLAIVTVVAALIDGGDPRWWLAVGALVGLGMLNKFTVVGVVVGLGVGLIATPQRRILKSTWLPAGAALALVFAAPTLIWQANHNWPQLEMSGAISGRDGPADYVLIQIAVLSFFLIIPAAAGWKWLMFDDLGRRWRSLAIAFVFLFIAFLASGGKGYYVAPLYLPLFAAGAIWFAGLRRSLMRTVGALVAVGAVAGLFVALPLLPPERADLVNEINKELGETYGWAQFVDQIEAVYLALPTLERDNAVIYTSNYGEAGAIELLGAGRLPQPVSGHNNYWLWGPGTRTGPIIGIGAVPDAIRGICTALTLETKITSSAGIENEEFGRDVWKCDTSTPLSSIWDDLRHYG